ncbi:MAG TPA: hypothetical protein DCL15_03235, partial [Chloroflexi bacterium]|nr:hypothetical protein [Chloroflexota bacterium]
EELPGDLTPPRTAFSADWLALGAVQINDAPAQTIAAAIGDDVTLVGYTVTSAPDGAPVTTAARAVDVTLVWQIAADWPSGLGVSLRPTAGGAWIPDPTTGGVIQRDAAAPVQGLVTPAPGATTRDVHRVPMPNHADGVMLIVYRATDTGFENLLELPLKIE